MNLLIFSKVLALIILCGISLPLILLFLIFKKPIEAITARIITLFWYLIQFLISLILGNTNIWLHYFIFAVSFSSYFILRAGSKQTKVAIDAIPQTTEPEEPDQSTFKFWDSN